MFPRVALAVFNHAKSIGAIVTLALCQDYFVEISCMLKDRKLTVDPKLNTLIGIHEEIVESQDQLFDLCQIIDEKRVTGKTKMNTTSSRSHFMIQFKMYQQCGDKVHVNMFKFMDMAGSERLSKTGLDPMSIEGYQCVYVNFSITTFTRVLEAMGRMKTVTGGLDLPKDVPWKESTITKIMKSCFDGTAFSSFILCVSTADKNSGETFHTCKFGQAAAGLKSKVTKPKQINSKARITAIETDIKKM